MRKGWEVEKVELSADPKGNTVRFGALTMANLAYHGKSSVSAQLLSGSVSTVSTVHLI